MVGHTDESGSRTHNLELNQKRAGAVAEMLKTVFKVNPARLLPVDLGEEQLLENTAPDDPGNRRVELVNIGPI